MNHLTKEELVESLANQAEALEGGGILLHTFWYGDKVEDLSGLLFTYYTNETFSKSVGEEYEVVESVRYTELETNDSIYFVLRKKG